MVAMERVGVIGVSVYDRCERFALLVACVEIKSGHRLGSYPTRWPWALSSVQNGRFFFLFRFFGAFDKPRHIEKRLLAL